MPKTLLLADDSVVIQKLVGLSFANEDVELTTTDNGDDAVTKARELKPDLVLADVVMPGKNGYEVCEAIKADPELVHIPVLLLTGTFEAFDEDRARAVRSDGHITKPFEAQALVDRVSELLNAAPAPETLAVTAPNLDGPVAAPAGPVADDAFDFFDDGVQDLGTSLDTGVQAPPPVVASPSPLEAGAIDLDAQAADILPQMESGEFDTPAPATEAAALGDELGGDQTIALMPDSLDAVAEPTVTSLAFDDGPALGDPPVLDTGEMDFDIKPGAPSIENAAPASTPAAWNDDGFDLDLPSTPEANPATMGGDMAAAPAAADDATVLADDFFDVDSSASTEPGANLVEPSAPASPIMSRGDTSSDSIAFGEAPDPAAANPNQTVLADDLFASEADAPIPPPIPTSDDGFDFGLDAASDLMDEPSISETPPPAASGFDVSSSDLGQSLSAVSPPPLPVEAPPALDVPAAIEEPLPSQPEPTPEPEMSVSEGLLGGVADLSNPAAEDPFEGSAVADPGMGGEDSLSLAEPEPRRPDLSPVMRDRIHETLEKVAWEAFADLSDTLVKQVLERVESIAWEVIPQMAEALVQEEIRRMKGEDED